MSFLDDISQEQLALWLSHETVIEYEDLELDQLYADEERSYARRRWWIGRAVRVLDRFFPAWCRGERPLSFVQLETRRLLRAGRYMEALRYYARAFRRRKVHQSFESFVERVTRELVPEFETWRYCSMRGLPPSGDDFQLMREVVAEDMFEGRARDMVPGPDGGWSGRLRPFYPVRDLRREERRRIAEYRAYAGSLGVVFFASDVVMNCDGEVKVRVPFARRIRLAESL